MFNNNGNEQYTFSAQYSTNFSLDRFQLHGLQDSTGVDYSVDYKDYYVRIVVIEPVRLIDSAF